MGIFFCYAALVDETLSWVGRGASGSNGSPKHARAQARFFLCVQVHDNKRDANKIGVRCVALLAYYVVGRGVLSDETIW